MMETEKQQPSFNELIDYVMKLVEEASNQNIDLLGSRSDEKRQQVLDLIASSDDRLRAGLIHGIGLSMLDKIENSINNQYGNKLEGAKALELLRIYSSNKI